jgi:hypothetical protein
MHHPREADLVPFADRDSQPIEETERKCRRWAAAGNRDSAWWLGHFCEFGGAAGVANGKASIAYYIASFRMDLLKWGEVVGDLFGRVYEDRYSLFSLSLPVSDEVRAEADQTLGRFREMTEGFISTDWRQAILIAEDDDRAGRAAPIASSVVNRVVESVRSDG